MRAQEFVDEDLTRRGFLRGLGAAAAVGATGGALAQAQPVDASKEFQNMRRDDPRVRHAQDINDLAKAIYQNMVSERGQPADRREQNKWMEIAHLKAEARFAQYKPGAQTATKPTAGFSSQGSEYRRARDIDNFESVAEAFDNPYKMKWEQSEYGDSDALVKLPDGTYLNIMFEHTTPYEVNISFWRNNSLEVTGEGDAQRIFATVLAAIQKFLKREQPANITFSASKDVEPGQNSESRAKLYNRMVQRYAAAWGYTVNSFDHGDQVTYELSRTTPADGEQQLDELSFLGSECTKDCSGHRAGYDWSKRKGLRQANSWSPSFNKGAGLAVAGK